MLIRCRIASAQPQDQSSHLNRCNLAPRFLHLDPRGRSSRLHRPADRGGLTRPSHRQTLWPASPWAGQALPIGRRSQKLISGSHEQSANGVVTKCRARIPTAKRPLATAATATRWQPHGPPRAGRVLECSLRAHGDSRFSWSDRAVPSAAAPCGWVNWPLGRTRQRQTHPFPPLQLNKNEESLKSECSYPTKVPV